MTNPPAPDERPRGFDADTPQADSMVRHEEELRVGTERLRTGRVRLRKRVVEEEQTFTVTVRHEEVDLIEEDLAGDDGTLADRGDRADRADGVDLDGPARSVDVTDSGRGAGAPGGGTRDAGGIDASDGDDDTVEIVLYAERPVVTMERVPVERVRLRRVRTQDEQTVTEEVLREDIEIDRDDVRDDQRDDVGDDLRPDRRGDLRDDATRPDGV